MNRPLRVLFVVEPGIDGVFRHVEGLIGECHREGLEVHLAYSDRRGSEGLRQLIRVVGERGGRCLNLGVGNAPEPRDLPAFWRLWSFVREVRPDVIHSHSSKAGVLVRALPFVGVRVPLFYSPHAYYGLAPRPGSALKNWFYNALESAFGRIGTTINISPDENRFAQETLGLPPERLRIIHNPVNARVFTPPTEEAKAEARRQLQLPEAGVILGSIGRLSFQKDPQTLYRAVARVLAENSRLLLYHVGQGELADEVATLALELGVESRIARRNYLEAPLAFYQAIDALIVPSRYEAGWPIVTLEALACDLPVISYDGPGSSDIGRSGLSHCWTAAPEDVAGFTRGIRDWLASRETPRPSNHRATAIARFSVEACFGAVIDLYRAALPTPTP